MEAKLQVSAEDWLKVYGLEANALLLDQLLPAIGFLQSKSEVGSLGRTVSSHYGDGVFIRQENSSGAVYNICGTSGAKLASIEEELKEAISSLKARYEWMTTGSRLSFGVVSGRRAVIVIDCYGTEPAWLSSLVQVATSVVQEQLIHQESFNFISCTSGVSCWKEGLVSVTDGHLEGVLQWLENIKPQTPPLKSNVVQALSKALEHTEADSVYLLSYGESSLRAFEQLLEKVAPSLQPVHLSVINCASEEKLEQYKSLANASNGKCHCYSPPSSTLTSSNPLLSSYSSLASSTSSSRRPGSGRNKTSRPSSAVVGSFPQGLTDTDTLAVWDELNLARDTLAQMQALRIEIEGATCNCSPEPPRLSDASMTSEQWLEVYGLKAKKLTFENLVGSLAFKHCNGMVQLPLPPKHKRTGKVEMVSHTKVVHAQYCKEFVHMRWPEGEVIHVLLSKHAHRVFCEGVEGVIGACRKRLEWLKHGSRELFGTLLEKKIVIVVDTSVSMGTRLAMLKKKLLELIKEQLSNKDQFTVFHFNSKVYPWRDNLVASSPQTLAAAAQWVEGLVTGGSTNTEEALVKAMTVSGVEAVYLMTDGRPDTPTDMLLAKVQQLPKVPVHTISFNCGDSKANHFLAKLASNTGGRYHYLSTDVCDPEGPKTYESDDITQLEEEIKRASETIERANQLLAECKVTNKRCGKKKQQKTNILRTMKDSDSSESGDGAMGKPLASSKKWLSKNSLAALKLTLMDALGPTSIPHTSKHVPILQKDVHSKVFSDLFSIAHISGSNKMSLIHPGAANLIGYEKQLDQQVEVYYSHLTRLAWEAIPDNNKSSVLQECGLNEGETPSYREHQDILKRVLNDLNWPRPQVEFDLIEKELQQAESYKQYSQSLREEVKKTHSSRSRNDSTYSVASSYGVPSMDNPLYHISKKSHSSRPSKSAKVIVRSKVDGFYYPGVVTNKQNRKSIGIQLADKLEISSSSSLIIPMGGARPCPVLYRGDHVLARVRTSKNGRHPGPDGRCDYYIPGVVQVLPSNERKGHALHSVVVFSGHVITCDRRGLVKISEKRYTETCEYIRAKMELESTSKRGTGKSRSQALYNGSSISMPSPPDSDQGSETSSVASTVQSSVQSRASSVASSKKSALSNGPSLTELMETQRVQEELIQKYREELLSMQEKQKKMEEQLASQLEQKDSDQDAEKIVENTQTQSETSIVATSSVHNETNENEQTEIEASTVKPDDTPDDFNDFFDNDAVQMPTAENPPSGVTEPEDVQHETNADPVAENILPDTELEPENNPSAIHTEVKAKDDPPVLHTDVGVNTDAMTEERGIVTEPMKESVAVGTECSSHSETESSVNGAEETDTVDNLIVAEPSTEELLVEHTLISTPLPTPPLSRAPSPHPSPPATPAPSEHTPSRPTSPTPSLDHVITPSQSHTSTLSHASPPHTNPPTPHITPLHSTLVAPPLINQQVLARWPDDGWYYRCVVVGAAGEGQWEVKDASEDMEIIPSCDIITDLVDSQRPLKLKDTVAGLHPRYSCSYAPGKIVGVDSDGLSFTIEFYDCAQNTLPRHEIYRLVKKKHDTDVEYIRQKEAEWVGVACLARKNSDGLYYPCKVERQVSWSRNYIVQWPDGSHQEQEVCHLYGALTRKRPLRIGDHVIALADQKVGVCMPGIITGTELGKIIVEFCDGQSNAVDPTHCYWVSEDYHAIAVEYICSHAPPPSTVGGDTTTTETDDVTEY